MIANAAIGTMQMMVWPPMRFTPEPHIRSDALRVVLLEPLFCGVHIGEDFDVVGIADLLAGVDVDKDGHWSLFSFRPRLKSARCAESFRDFLGPDVDAKHSGEAPSEQTSRRLSSPATRPARTGAAFQRCRKPTRSE